MHRIETISPPASGFWNFRLRDAEGVVFALASDANPLASGFEIPFDDVLPDVAAVVRTGWLDGRHDPEARIFQAGFRTWAQAGRDAYDEAIARVAHLARGAGREVWLWPHARHVLGDAQRVLTETRDWDDASPFRVMLEPTAMLTPSMLDAAEDHLLRIVDTLADSPRTACVLISDAELVEIDPSKAPAGTSPGPELRSVPVGHGVLGAAVLAKIAAAADSAGATLLLHDDALDDQRAIIGV
ncbi:MAG: hypothetical protein AAF235_01975 [Planctomycetota bacterium]